MSDYVEKLLQNRLPIFEAMGALNFLSPEHQKSLVNNLREQLIQAEATKEPSRRSIFDYANFEAYLLAFIKEKRQETNETKFKNEIEIPLARALTKYFMTRTNRRTDDIILWRFRINFLLNVEFLPETRIAYRELTKSNPWHISVWIDWANFEMCINKSFEMARKILLDSAPKHIPDTNVFARELFRLELLYVEHVMKKEKTADIISVKEDVEPENTSNNGKKKVINLELARVVYKCNSTEDVKLCIEMHNISSKFPFAKSLREEIYNDIKERFINHPEVLCLIHARNVCNLKTENDDLTDHLILDISPDQEETKANDKISKIVNGYNIVNLLNGASEKLRVYHLFHSKLYQKYTLTRHTETSNWLKKAANYIEYITEEAITDTGNLISKYWQEMKSLLYHGWSRHFPHILWSLKKIIISCPECITENMYLDFCIMYPILADPSYENVELSSRGDVSRFNIDEVLRSAVERLPNCGDNVFVMLFKLMPALADNSALIQDYMSLKKLKERESTFRHDAMKLLRYPLHRVVHDKLLGAEKEKFILDDLKHGGSSLPEYKAKLKLEHLKHAYRKRGLAGAREVYAQHGHVFPYLESFQATMFLMECCAPGVQEASQPATQASMGQFNFPLVNYGYENQETKVNPVDDSNYDDSDYDSDDSNSEKEKKNRRESNEAQKKQPKMVFDGRDQDNEDPKYSREQAVEKDRLTDDNDKSFEREDIANLKFRDREGDINIHRVTKIFENDILKGGGKHHDVWLCYWIFNQRTRVLGASDIEKRALEATEPRSHMAFQELLSNKKLGHYANPEKQQPDVTVNEVDEPTLPILFQLDEHFLQVLTPQQLKARAAYLKSILSPDTVPDMSQSDVTWSDVLTVLLDGKRLGKCYLDAEKEFFVDENYVIGDAVCPSIALTDSGHAFFWVGERRAPSKLSDCLHLSAREETTRSHYLVTTKRDDSYFRDDLRVIKSKSFLLNPENSKKSWTVEKNKCRREKRDKLKEKYVKKAGKGWENMGRPEMTDEVQMDLDTLVMRNVLQPGKHLKNFEIPDNFVMGTIVGGGADFFSTRTKKQRKRTIAEEYMDDYENNRLHKNRKVMLNPEPQEAKVPHTKKKALDANIKKGKSDGKNDKCDGKKGKSHGKAPRKVSKKTKAK